MLAFRPARHVRARNLVRLGVIAALTAASLSPGPRVAQAEQQLPPARAVPPPAPAATAEAALPLEPARRSAYWLQPAEAGQLPVLAYAPGSSQPRAPLMMMLHGMCDSPQNECPSFGVGSTSGHWVVCPRANLRCDGGGSIWSGDPKRRYELVQSTLERMHAELAGRVEPSAGGTLVGFSLGSFVAVDVAHRSHGQWRNLLLIGAKVEPDARLLTQAGVRSVLLASGDRDMMKWHMVGVAQKLKRRGVRATYMSMGDVGHWFARDMDSWMSQAMAWFGQEEG